MTGFEAEVHRLSARAKDFDGFVDQAARLSAALDSALAGARSAWGDDLVGQSFSAAHAEPSETTAGAVRKLAAGLGEVGGSFAEAAARYSAADDAAQQSIGTAVGESGAGAVRPSSDAAGE